MKSPGMLTSCWLVRWCLVAGFLVRLCHGMSHLLVIAYNNWLIPSGSFSDLCPMLSANFIYLMPATTLHYIALYFLYSVSTCILLSLLGFYFLSLYYFHCFLPTFSTTFTTSLTTSINSLLSCVLYTCLVLYYTYDCSNKNYTVFH